ncbi:malonyl-CoA decarboxylase [Telmatospirillum sp. J64-1]|uniref:malonyl-CoA decarboxylase n=1 Tax=Telmatospirillum sp. J64-1 TaxID=2502183 RepID=UPI00115EE089|nr:malonyl-CoA decarboxylase [Telmatospirillum sp. J64-1]
MNRLFFLDLLSTIADRGREILDISTTGGSGGTKTIEQLCRDLLSGRGEATGTALAREVAQAWAALPPERHLDFFTTLVQAYSPDPEAVTKAAQAYTSAPDHQALARLGQVVEPPRQELIRRINMAPGGTATVVSMRAALGRLLRDHPELKVVDADFQHLLSSWFNRGFLVLRSVNWNTPASILEKLIAYEAVHEIQGWEDLRRRLAPDRRCFAFFHPAMSDEPLIFVEVALVHKLSDNVGDILSDAVDEAAARSASTAIFYSISNCQEGLRGISFGNFLIKQVVEELSREMPSLRTFATLSPIPGFMGWLKEQAEGKEPLFPSEEARLLLEATSQRGWHADADKAEALRMPLLRAAARYLAKARRGDMPRDPVARFHLGNGARLEQLNWMANTSPKGLKESAGMMVNYAYRLPEIERNHEALLTEGRIITSRSVRTLAAA